MAGPGKKLVKPGERLRAGKTLPELTCNSCGETKKATRFPKLSGKYKVYKPTDPRRYMKQCKRCLKPAKPGQSREDVTEPAIAWRKNQKKKKPKKKKRSIPRKEYKAKVRRETRIKSMVYLAQRGCAECGERDPRKLEYDHKVPSKKERQISRLITEGYSWSSPILRQEIRKCRVLCANCHRVHTIKQQGYYAEEEVQRALGKLAARYQFNL